MYGHIFAHQYAPTARDLAFTGFVRASLEVQIDVASTNGYVYNFINSEPIRPKITVVANKLRSPEMFINHLP